MAEPKAQTTSADPAVIDAERYSVEAEDEHVRVLRVRYGPKAKSIMHSHPASVAVTLTNVRCRFTYPDGSSEEHQLQKGTAMLLPAGPHLPENLSDEPMEIVLIELKQ
jgi:quercetin dioxygenase-like cupin family protein